MSRVFPKLFIILAAVALIPVFDAVFARGEAISVQPPQYGHLPYVDPAWVIFEPQFIVTSPNSNPPAIPQAFIDEWLVGTQNSAILRPLIWCESQNRDISRPDSNGRDSDGILQFNRSNEAVLGSGTWAEFAPLAGVSSTPLDPQAAIKVADWMISHGELYRWGCSRILGFVR